VFVCPLAKLCKNYWTDLRENFTRQVSVDKRELIEAGKLTASASGCRKFFLKDSSALQQTAFCHSLAHMLGSSDILSEICLWTMRSPLHVEAHLDLRSRVRTQTLDSDSIHLVRGHNSLSALVSLYYLPTIFFLFLIWRHSIRSKHSICYILATLNISDVIKQDVHQVISK